MTDVEHTEPDDSQRQIAAWHEAAHAVVFYTAGLGARAVSINEAGGGRCAPPDHPPRITNSAEVIRYVIAIMSGPITECIAIGATPAEARLIWLRSGGADRETIEVGLQILRDVEPHRDWWRYCRTRAGRIIRALWETIELVARALITKSSLSAVEVAAIVEFGPTAVQS